MPSPLRHWPWRARSVSRPRSPTCQAAPSPSGIPSGRAAAAFSSRCCTACVVCPGASDWPRCVSAAARESPWSSSECLARGDMHELDDLEQRGVMCWRAEDQAWVADPERVVQALTTQGFQEYRRELAKGHRDQTTSGGMWQGLDARTGGVATVIWVAHGPPPASHVFIEIDGRRIEGSAWAEMDDAVLRALAAGGGRLTLAQIAKRVGMSEDAAQSVV